MFLNRYRLQEAAIKPGGEGGGEGAPNGAANGEWLKAFGDDGAKAFGDTIKQPADLVKGWTDSQAELTKLRANSSQGYDWRKAASTIDGKEDEGVQKALSRYNDLPAAAKALVEAQNKIRTGELAKPLAKDATPEQVKEWRAANGIPVEPKGYWENLPDGIVIGQDDQPVFDAYGALAHKHNAPPALMHEFAKTYYESLNKSLAAEREVDKQDAAKATQELQQKYGPDYQTNMALLNNWMDGLPEDVKGVFKDATLGDGTRMMNSPEVMDFLISAARQLNPAAHLLPPGGEGNMASIASEIAKIEGLMRTNRSAYNKDEKLQQRYRDLISAQGTLKERHR